jgi:type I restriction enzyme, R subunit
VRNLVMARFTHSSILYQQMRGRGTRLAPGKDRFTMWDFTGVTLRHGDDETPGEGGVVVVREGKPPIYQARRLLMLDVHDEIDPTTREWVTVDETGHAFMDVDEARAEALGGVFETWLNGQLPVWVPPLPLQSAFAQRASRIESLARHLDDAAAKAEAMAAGLSAELFG